MTVEELLAQVVMLLQHEGRLSYRLLKRRFGIDDEYLEDLKAELIDAKRLAIDEDNKVLVWVGNAEKDKGKRITEKGGNGETEVVSAQLSVVSPQPLAQPPITYTPTHLAERIRAEQAALEARGKTDGERKTITALFADLKGLDGIDRRA